MGNYKNDNSTAPSWAKSEPNIYKTSIDAPAEYSQALPDGTKAFSLSMWPANAEASIYYAWEEGETMNPTGSSNILNGAFEKYEDGLNLSGKTLYFACDVTEVFVIIETWR